MKKIESKVDFSYRNTKTGDSVDWSYQYSETETSDDKDLKPRKGVDWGVIMPLIAIAFEKALRLIFGG